MERLVIFMYFISVTCLVACVQATCSWGHTRTTCEIEILKADNL